APACPLAGRCGGCDWLYLDLGAGDVAHVLERGENDLQLRLALERLVGVKPIAASATSGERACRRAPRRRLRGHLEKLAAEHLALLDDIGDHALSGQRALDEHGSA